MLLTWLSHRRKPKASVAEPLESFTPYATTGVDALLTELEAIRRQAAQSAMKNTR
jgi:DNA-binding IclR family transcriptional regulator